jgi:hypothetical protein
MENEWKVFCLAATKRALRALNEGASAGLFWDAYDNYHEHDARFTFYALVQNADHIYSPKKRYFAAKQLHHFVRHGSQRIGAQADGQGLMVSAYRNAASNALIVVGLKQDGANRIQIVLLVGESAPVAWDVYATTRTVDCLKLDSVPVKNGAAEFELPDEAVFTLVGNLK